MQFKQTWVGSCTGKKEYNKQPIKNKRLHEVNLKKMGQSVKIDPLINTSNLKLVAWILL